MTISIAMLVGYVLFPVLIILLFSKVKWTQKVGTVMMAYAVGIIIALTGVLPTGTEPGAEQLASWQKLLMNVAVPLAIPLMLFNSDFKLWTKSLPKTMAVLLGGIFSVLVALVVGYFVFRNQDVPQFEKVAAMMTGIYTGGTMNFNSLGLALEVDPSLIVLTLTFEEIVTFPLILFIVAGGYKLFRKIMPYPDTTSVETSAEDLDALEESFENYKGILTSGGML